jgi:hypothetical protein
MDALCKLAFLAAEYILKDTDFLDSVGRNKTGLVFSNRSSSLETDRLHAASIKDKNNYFPSPSVFVYTLPNIGIGEICIRHQLTGENAFFVSPVFDAERMSLYVNQLMEEEAIRGCLSGWTELDGSAYEAFVYLVGDQSDSEKNSNFRPHSATELKGLYK